MTTDSILMLRTTIKKAAKSVAYNWPGVVEEDDIEQMINLRLLKSPGSIEKIILMDRQAQYRAIVGMGHQLASQERADYDNFKGSYRYSLREVKNVLNSGVLVEEFDNFHEVVFDLKQAMEVLEGSASQYARAIYKRYLEWETPQDKNGQNALARALEALTVNMNKSNKRQFSNRHDGPGTRKPIRAEAAHYQSKKNWDDESAEAVGRLMNQARVSGR